MSLVENVLLHNYVLTMIKINKENITNIASSSTMIPFPNMVWV